MRVGRANDKNGEQRIWAGTVMLKPSINAEKAKHDGPMDQRTNRPTDIAGYTDASTRLETSDAGSQYRMKVIEPLSRVH